MSGNADSRISEATRKKVLEAAKALNYVPNTTARALVTGKTHRLGVVTNSPHSLTNLTGYHLGILSGIMYGAVANNYNLLIHSSQYPTWSALYDDIRGGGADGVLLVGEYINSALGATLVADQFPAVFISHCPQGERVFSVDCDNVQGGYIAAKHLIGLGQKNIAYLTRHKGQWVEERRIGVESAIRDANLAGNAVKSLFKFVPKGAEEAVKALLKAHDGKWGVVTSDEMLGIEIGEILFAMGRRVPQDIAIVNFNSTEESVNARVAMSSIYQPLCEIGFTAASLLANLLSGQEVTPGVRRLPVRLDIRDSCGARSTTSEEH